MRKKIGDFKIEWPLSNKFSEWNENEIKDLEALEYSRGEYGGLTLQRNFSDGNPIRNNEQDFLETQPGNLFYQKATKGFIRLNMYDVSVEGGYDGFRYTSPCHWTQNVEFLIMKVNNGEQDGYVVFCKLQNDEGDDDEIILMLSSWDKVLDSIKNAKKKIQEDWFEKIENLIA